MSAVTRTSSIKCRFSSRAHPNPAISHTINFGPPLRMQIERRLGLGPAGRLRLLTDAVEDVHDPAPEVSVLDEELLEAEGAVELVAAQRERLVEFGELTLGAGHLVAQGGEDVAALGRVPVQLAHEADGGRVYCLEAVAHRLQVAVERERFCLRALDGLEGAEVEVAEETK